MGRRVSRTEAGKRSCGMRRGLASIVGGLLLCALAGCSSFGGTSLSQWWRNGFKVGPNYGKPVAQVADDWIDSNDARVINAPADYANWWQTFNDPVLDYFVQAASNQNMSLRAAGFRIEQARALRRIAAGALFPQTQVATADFQRVKASQSIANPAPVPHFDDWDAGFDLGWELDLWGRFRRAVEEQDARLDASIENYDDVLVILQADVAATYVQIREFERRLVYVRQNAASQKAIYELTLSRQRAGAVSELDVKQAENIWRTTEAIVPALVAGMRQSQHAMAVLMGVPPHDMTNELGSARSIPVAPKEIVVGIPADLLRRRPDVRRAEREVAAQSARIGIAQSDLYPAFTIFGSLGWEAESFSDLLSTSAFRGNIGPSVRWNILNYGRIRSNVAAEDARFQELVVLYEEAVLKANAEVEDAIVGFLQAQEELAQIVEAEAAARRSLELATTQYREGATDFTRVLLATDFLTRSQDQLARTQANVAANLIQLYKALGGGWTSRLVQPSGRVREDGQVDPRDAVPLPQAPRAEAMGLGEDQLELLPTPALTEMRLSPSASRPQFFRLPSPAVSSAQASSAADTPINQAAFLSAEPPSRP
jgi:NodT family efflux transporter outer membrane factor (OMF) lipoprotein